MDEEQTLKEIVSWRAKKQNYCTIIVPDGSLDNAHYPRHEENPCLARYVEEHEVTFCFCSLSLFLVKKSKQRRCLGFFFLC